MKAKTKLITFIGGAIGLAAVAGVGVSMINFGDENKKYENKYFRYSSAQINIDDVETTVQMQIHYDQQYFTPVEADDRPDYDSQYRPEGYNGLKTQKDIFNDRKYKGYVGHIYHTNAEGEVISQTREVDPKTKAPIVKALDPNFVNDIVFQRINGYTKYCVRVPEKDIQGNNGVFLGVGETEDVGKHAGYYVDCFKDQYGKFFIINTYSTIVDNNNAPKKIAIPNHKGTYKLQHDNGNYEWVLHTEGVRENTKHYVKTYSETKTIAPVFKAAFNLDIEFNSRVSHVDEFNESLTNIDHKKSDFFLIIN